MPLLDLRTDGMALIQLQSVFVLIFIAVGRILGESTNLGDSFKFATNETQRCRDGDVMLIRVLMTTEPDRFSPVAKVVGGFWTHEKGYNDRIVHHSPSSLILRNITYNDAGLYEFTCDGSRIDGVQLNVVIPLYVPVTEGQTAKLPCFFFCAGVSIKKIKWTLNGSLVLEQDQSPERSSRGSGFERASVAPDWYRTGDLSLTVERAQLEDQGEYICHVTEEQEKRGSPGPVRLRVHKNPHQNISSGPPKGCPTPGAPEESAMGPGTIISITLNVALFVTLIIFIIWLRFHRPATTGGRCDGQGTQKETVGLDNRHQGHGQSQVLDSNDGGCLPLLAFVKR